MVLLKLAQHVDMDYLCCVVLRVLCCCVLSGSVLCALFAVLHTQAHVAPVTDVQQVKAVVAVLLESNKIRNATHNIMAYRIAVPDKPGVFVQDCDDDGEAAAGGRLLHLLQVAGASLGRQGACCKRC